MVMEPAELRKLLRYEPETGKLYWLPRTAGIFADGDRIVAQWNSRLAGKEAFTAVSKQGYRVSRIFNRGYYAHRVIWALHHGEWPKGEVDHINGDRSDNRISNLRNVSRAENCRNTARSVRNKSGAVGVHWHKQTQKWHARIKRDGKTTSLGLFFDFDDAVAARKAAEPRYDFHENHGRAAA